tara:strand:+ start:454 stop:1458 length:1005 start_codon:yes stop_codon:yes gene_type:complete
LTYIIAEIGVNHNGAMDLAHKLIDKASECGVNAVKFQTFTAKSLVNPTTPKVPYQLSTSSPDESHYEMISSLELKYEDHFELKRHCDEINIDFLSTPYDIKSAIFLEEKLNVKYFKTASADIVDLPLQEYIASTNKGSIVSVGMATIEEIKLVDNIYKRLSKLKPTYLHCVSNYPCSDASLNLKVLSTLKEVFGCPIGYSDHSVGYLASVISIALGATVIEKHFTLDKSLPGPDHAASSSPDDLLELVENVRLAEKQLGHKDKQPQEEELKMKAVSRKSLHFSRNLPIGHSLSVKDFILMRPGTGVYYENIETFLGKTLKNDVREGQIASYDLI